MASTNGSTNASVSELESQRYDRQIRVWGNEAQNLIKNSNVLICGLRGLHSEVRTCCVVWTTVTGCIESGGEEYRVGWR
jgi:hypothetical protein